MNPTIRQLSEKKLIGKKLTMSLANNRTIELWKSFMPRRQEIKHMASTDLLSMQIYPYAFDFKNFDANAEFEKWAAVEVTTLDHTPLGMETYSLPEGTYAVFLHKGDESTAEKTFRFIFETWLPHSDYALDQRPHFELLGEKYKHSDPDSEEEVWIPVTLKQKEN